MYLSPFVFPHRFHLRSRFLYNLPIRSIVLKSTRRTPLKSWELFAHWSRITSHLFPFLRALWNFIISHWPVCALRRLSYNVRVRQMASFLNVLPLDLPLLLCCRQSSERVLPLPSLNLHGLFRCCHWKSRPVVTCQSWSDVPMVGVSMCLLCPSWHLPAVSLSACCFFLCSAVSVLYAWQAHSSLVRPSSEFTSFW